MRTFGIIFSFFMLLGITSLNYQPIQERNTPPNIQKVLETIRNIQQQEGIQNASLGIVMIDHETGKELVNYGGEKSMTPASVQKIITTSTALNILGPEFQFETTVAYSGKIIGGVLKGNIYVIGGGDPTLSDNLFSTFDWKSLGIKEIHGKIIGDGAIFSSQTTPSQWIWEDLGNYYGAGVSGLNLHQNTFKIHFKSGAPGSKTTVLSQSPEIPDISFDNQVIAGKEGSGDNAYIFGAPYTYSRIIRGTIPPHRSKFSIKGSIPDPTYWAAYSLHQHIQNQGIIIKEDPTTTHLSKKSLPQSLHKIYTVKSPSLSEIIKKTNQKSINLYAEALLRIISVQEENDSNPEVGLKILKDYWSNLGINTQGMILKDGSGLSPFNAITPRQIAEIFKLISKHQNAKKFKESLAVSGASGTFKKLCKNSIAEGKIVGKSGSFSSVLTYAGYINTNQGHTLSFAIFVNHYDQKTSEVRKQIEKLMISAVQNL